MHVRSQPGRGSYFSIDLPLSQHKNLRKQTTTTSKKIGISGLFVLVVDDDRAVLNATGIWLRSLDSEVLLSQSREETLAELKQHRYPAPGVIISNYRLPLRQTGLDVVSSIRNYFSSQIPAIIISGDLSAEIIRLTHEAGCEYLKKPVQEAEFLNLLAQVTHSEPDIH